MLFFFLLDLILTLLLVSFLAKLFGKFALRHLQRHHHHVSNSGGVGGFCHGRPRRTGFIFEPHFSGFHHHHLHHHPFFARLFAVLASLQDDNNTTTSNNNNSTQSSSSSSTTTSTAPQTTGTQGVTSQNQPTTVPTKVEEPAHTYSETATEYTITVDLPGFDRSQVDLTILDDTREIVVDAVPAQTKAALHARPRYTLKRQLPRLADLKSVKASLNLGVLTLVLPKLAKDGRSVDVLVPGTAPVGQAPRGGNSGYMVVNEDGFVGV